MNVALMRKIDRYLGVPMCWVFGILRTLFRQSKTSSRITRILVIKLFGIGSIILSTPALSLLRKAYPDVQIDFLSFESNRQLLERYPCINRTLSLRTQSLFEFVSDILRLVFHLWGEPYDVVFDFEFFSKFSTLLSNISGASRRIGFALPTRWRVMLLTHQVHLSKEKHVSEAFCDQVFCLMGQRTIPQISPPAIRKEDVQSMKEILPLNGKPVIAINVNASDTFLERRWLPERFAELVSKLSADNQKQFFFIGLEHERDYVQQVISMTSCQQRCYNIAGMLTLPELAAFLQRCEMLISGDSGPVHLAAALGIRVVGLYGPETPQFYGPLGEDVTTVYKAIPCSPCMNIYTAKSFRCPYSARCMKEIHVDEIESTIEELSEVA